MRKRKRLSTEERQRIYETSVDLIREYVNGIGIQVYKRNLNQDLTHLRYLAPYIHLRGRRVTFYDKIANSLNECKTAEGLLALKERDWHPISSMFVMPKSTPVPGCSCAMCDDARHAEYVRSKMRGY